MIYTWNARQYSMRAPEELTPEDALACGQTSAAKANDAIHCWPEWLSGSHMSRSRPQPRIRLLRARARKASGSVSFNPSELKGEKFSNFSQYWALVQLSQQKRAHVGN
jgi:hypothetical protein